MKIMISDNRMTIKKPDGESLTIELNKSNGSATVTNGSVVPLTINVNLALQIAMHAMNNGMYTLDELYPLSKLVKRKMADSQAAHESTWGITIE